ncbi:MAG: ornithine cyclodeaminase family protein, partial [Anaerolineae bacterium]
MKLRVLSKRDVQQAVPMREAIEIVKGAFAQLSAGKAVVPLRTQLPVERHEGVTLFMPAYLSESDDLGVKIVSVFPGNLEMGLPTIFALVVVVEAATGRPVAAMDGTYLTALRTGAASGAATDLLARQDARVAAIFGAGAQGRTQLLAVCEVRDIERAWVYDINPKAAERYVQEMAGKGRAPADLRVTSSPAEATREADVICTATTSQTPVFADGDLKPGVHINAVGSFTPQMQEIPEQTVGRVRIVVGSREGCLSETGDLIIPIRKGLITEDDIYTELGEIAAGIRPGRESAEEIT